MDSDLTFITNEPGHILKDRFEVLIKDSRLFDCLVGYFYTSGFYAIYKSLESTEKIRILIGIKTGRQTYELVEKAKSQDTLNFSPAETKEEFSNAVVGEMEKSRDKAQVEKGVQKFIEWLKNGKIDLLFYCMPEQFLGDEK